MNSKRRTKIATVACVAIVAILVLCTIHAYRTRSEPVLIHLFAETGCACGDYHEEVSGLVIRNPFRDRSPERAANAFLEELREGRCAETPVVLASNKSLCIYALEGHRVSSWQLVNRQDQNDRVLLYFKLTKFGTESESKSILTGEGTVRLTESGGRWSVTGYSSYF